MTTKTDELKREALLPCPFCGGSVSFHQDDEECRDGCHYIECKMCGTFDLSTAADPTNTVEDLGELRARIAPLWNRRAALQSQDEDIFSPTSLTGLSKDELIRQLQWALNYWMPNIADDGTPDGERAAREAYLLLGMQAPVGRKEENTPTYWERVSDLQSQDRKGAFCVWHNDPETDNSWDTGCRQLFDLYDGTPSENRMSFCCYCGKPIQEAIDHATGSQS